MIIGGGGGGGGGGDCAAAGVSACGCVQAQASAIRFAMQDRATLPVAIRPGNFLQNLRLIAAKALSWNHCSLWPLHAITASRGSPHLWPCCVGGQF